MGDFRRSLGSPKELTSVRLDKSLSPKGSPMSQEQPQLYKAEGERDPESRHNEKSTWYSQGSPAMLTILIQKTSKSLEGKNTRHL